MASSVYFLLTQMLHGLLGVLSSYSLKAQTRSIGVLRWGWCGRPTGTLGCGTLPTTLQRMGLTAAKLCSTIQSRIRLRGKVSDGAHSVHTLSTNSECAHRAINMDACSKMLMRACSLSLPSPPLSYPSVVAWPEATLHKADVFRNLDFDDVIAQNKGQTDIFTWSATASAWGW